MHMCGRGRSLFFGSKFIPWSIYLKMKNINFIGHDFMNNPVIILFG